MGVKIESKKNPLVRVWALGAKDGIRTRDPDLGKVVLYQLSYFREQFWDCKCIKILMNSRFFLLSQKFFYLIQFHQSLNRSQGIDIGIQDIILDLLKRRVVKLDEAELVSGCGIVFLTLCFFIQHRGSSIQILFP